MLQQRCLYSHGYNIMYQFVFMSCCAILHDMSWNKILNKCKNEISHFPFLLFCRQKLKAQYFHAFITAGMCVDLAIQLTLMLWRPSASHEYLLYLLATMWGSTDGIWQTQINSQMNIYLFCQYIRLLFWASVKTGLTNVQCLGKILRIFPNFFVIFGACTRKCSVLSCIGCSFHCCLF